MPRPVLAIHEPYTPEMLAEAAAAIEGLLDKKAEVFEFGGGYSTVWLSGRCKRVVWVESDAGWYHETDRTLREVQRVSKARGILVDGEEDIAAAIENYGEFDLVLVDCLDRQRAAAVKAAVAHVRPGGYLVLDDSQWAMLSEAKELLAGLGWEATVYSGNHRRKSGAVMPHETTIYQRPVEPEPEMVIEDNVFLTEETEEQDADV